MGSSASNQNRASSADVERHKGRSRSRSRVSDDGRDLSLTQSSSQTLPSRTESVQELSLKMRGTRTNVVALTSHSLKDKEPADSSSSLCENQDKNVQEYELQLAKAESQKLDLMDQINVLKQNGGITTKHHAALPPLGEHGSHLKETTFAKDQYIAKLEKDLQAAQKEVVTVRQKLKRRIKTLTSQLNEVRQESSINQMEMKAVISEQKEKLEKLKNNSSASTSQGASGVAGEDSSHSKIIVELSNQLSEQADQIACLQSEIMAKDQKLREMEEKIAKQGQSFVDSSSVSMDRLPSGRGKRVHKNTADNGPYRPGLGHKEHEVSPVFERQSTALSDSDSDWELESVPSKIHSAPVGSRVKSAVSVASSTAKNEPTNIYGNDDSILGVSPDPNVCGGGDVSSSSRRAKHVKKSALKTQLERKKNANQINALIGPSLAFAPKTKEPPSDTSCEPTPRCSDTAHLSAFPGLHVVNTVSH